MKFLSAIVFLIVVGLASSGAAQTNLPVFQSGLTSITPGHVPVFITNGVVGDGGPADSGNLTELGIVNTGTPFCINDAPISSLSGYHQFCLGALSLGGGLLSYNAYGGATPLALTCVVNGVQSPCLGSVSGLPSVANNASLKLLPLSDGPTVYRAGFYVQGDGGEAVYNLSSSNCSIPGGDNGSQVQPTTGTGCWLLSPQTQYSILIWGAPTDGVTDAGAAINACEAVEASCFVPPLATGSFFVSTPIVVPPGKWLVGAVSDARNAATAFTYTQTSAITCKNSIAQNCVTQGVVKNLASGGIRDITIAGAAGTPASGAKGIVFAGGYNVRLINVSVANFDTCIEFDQGISGQGVNNYLQQCATHYWVFNGWPEYSQTGGRDGANGTGNYNTALDNVYFTGGGTGGAGPNSIDFTNYKFENDQTPCWLRWGNLVGSPSAKANYNFVNVYKEPGATGGTSLFCSDSTVSIVSNLRVDNLYASQDSGVMTIANGMYAGTEMDNWRIRDSQLYTSASTIAPTSATIGFNNDVFSGNFFSSLTLTPGGSSQLDRLNLVGNHYNGSLTVNAGMFDWFSVNIVGDEPSGGFTCNTSRASVSGMFLASNPTRTPCPANVVAARVSTSYGTGLTTMAAKDSQPGGSVEVQGWNSSSANSSAGIVEAVGGVANNYAQLQAGVNSSGQPFGELLFSSANTAGNSIFTQSNPFFITGLPTTPGGKQPLCIDSSSHQIYVGSGSAC